MILYSILLNDESKVKSISNYLIHENYALSTQHDEIETISLEQKKKSLRLFFLTKALLFEQITKDLKSNFPETELSIYSSPITHIEPELWQSLKSKLKSV